MPDLSPIVLITLILLAWTLVATAIVLVFVVIPARRRVRDEDLGPDMTDRRATRRDRRVGLPDTRPVRVERRQGPSDRRRGPAAMA